MSHPGFARVTEPPFTIAVLISGGGTTLRNLIERRDHGHLNAGLGLVISSNRDAAGNALAERAGIPCRVVDYRDYATAETISEPVFSACREARADLVVMAGFLRRAIIPDDFVNRVVNIHPSLIPAHCGPQMYGMRVHRSVLESGSRLTGCTVHFVDNQYDQGPIIAQQSVPVLDDDTPDQLAARVFQAECELYPRVINAIAAGQISVVGDEVVYGPPTR